MAFAYSPKIVTDGLVFAVDAANTKSYPGSGTTWKDLSGNGNDGTLVNGPTFDSGNGGSLVFDGTDDYVSISNFNSDDILGQNFSVVIWIKADSVLSGRKALITNQTDYNTNGWALAMNPQGGLNRLFLHINDTTVILADPNPFPNPLDWHMVVGIWNNTNTTQSLYFDGVLYTTSNFPDVIINSNTSLRIAGHLNGGRNYTGNIGLTQIYNRALTPQEISQNYNALKSRFGL